MTTSQIDTLAAETAAYMTSLHPDYGILAARIAISNLRKNIPQTFSGVVEVLYKHNIVPKHLYDLVVQHDDEINARIDHSRNNTINYFAFRTLERSYLLRVDDKVIESPQDMYMRVALGIHGKDLPRVFETYDLMSTGWFIHASPTLYNAGTIRPQMSSCFLLPVADDSIEGIYDTLKQCAVISKYAGGIGMSVHNIRASGSYIHGTNGKSNGIIPMLRVFSSTARYVDQGGGKRKGGFAVYIEPWHADIFDFLNLRKNHGKEEMRARDIFTALWICDLFMKRVLENEKWTLFCPNEARGLSEVYGEEFNALYEKYEKEEGRGRTTISAQTLWYAILDSQIETGTPYMLYKDACNKKSNHKHLGTIKCSNLCTEIIEYSNANETAVCNLASISLPRFVRRSDGGDTLDHGSLARIVHVVVRNLNKVIDNNHYPTNEALHSNLRHRPIGVGVQGLADVFMMLQLPFESKEALRLNTEIFETIYFAALDASCNLAKEHGNTYQTYNGSPVANGQLQMDMWEGVAQLSGRHDWTSLRQRIANHGLRNSLLVAPMPTASTAQILGNNECFEPYTSNIYVRRVLSGEFIVVNQHLIRELGKIGLWNPLIKDKIIADNGSVQGIEEIPQHLKQVFKTVWEIRQRAIIDLAVARAPFIDQSQSMNLFVEKPTYQVLTSMHMYAWMAGLKTGMYYLRTRPAADAIKFTIDKAAVCDSCAA